MTVRHCPAAVHLLLIEDNPDDVEFTREAFRDAKVCVNLEVASDGVEALAFLRKEGQYADAPRPDLVLLDLNLPKKKGLEVLAEMRADEGLKRLPVVILTASSAEEDILKSYDLNANSYITKPVDLAGLTEVVKAIDEFWFTVVRLPSE